VSRAASAKDVPTPIIYEFAVAHIERLRGAPHLADAEPEQAQDCLKDRK